MSDFIETVLGVSMAISAACLSAYALMVTATYAVQFLRFVGNAHV
jgi:hypothetical protein